MRVFARLSKTLLKECRNETADIGLGTAVFAFYPNELPQGYCLCARERAAAAANAATGKDWTALEAEGRADEQGRCWLRAYHTELDRYERIIPPQIEDAQVEIVNRIPPYATGIDAWRLKTK